MTPDINVLCNSIEQSLWRRYRVTGNCPAFVGCAKENLAGERLSTACAVST
jgi:hypothetical protein